MMIRYLYVVDGASGCTFKHDIGENSYTMVLSQPYTKIKVQLDGRSTRGIDNVFCLKP